VTIKRDTLESVIDSLEYRVAQLEDLLYKEASESDKRTLRKRRQRYYAEINRATADA
jgi:hypothetical protein